MSSLLSVPVESRARSIRACRRDDLPAVAALYECVVRSGKRTPPPRLAEYFERTFFDCPWADPEIPSLVYEDDGGRILGFVGSHVRRLRFDGRRLRIACGGQLVVDPDERTRAIGAMLFRTRLAGAQDATMTDGANDTVRRMWEICGGETASLKTLTWTRIFRPLRSSADYLLGKLRHRALAPRLHPLWKALDPLVARRLRPAPSALRREHLAPGAILEHLGAVTESLRCHPDYDAAFLSWLFREMSEVKSRGTLVRTLLRDSRGEFVGWYVYYLDQGVSQVLQVAAKRGAIGEVLDDLFDHAAAAGAAALRGRLEPQLLGALAKRKCLYGWSGSALLHARAPALLGVLLSSQCWLERLDGESWMGHHTETFT